MKKLWTMAALTLAAGFTHAQDWSPDIYSVGKIYPGYIIKSDGTKVEGYLKAQGRGALDDIGFSNQNRVVFFSDPDNRKTKATYKPEDLKAYMIADKYYKTMNYSGGLMGKSLRFLLQVKEGCIAQYVWYFYKSTTPAGEVLFDEKVILQKNDEKPIEQSSLALKFADKVSGLVSDFTDLANKVKSKEKGYGLLNIDKIIEEYNAWCKENK